MPSRRPVAWRFAGTCRIRLLLRDWPVPESEGSGLQSTPRGQAGPKRRRETPQNKAMVRPNPIKPASPVDTTPALLATPTGSVFPGLLDLQDCGLGRWRRGPEMSNHNVRPCPPPYHAPGSHLVRAACAPGGGKRRLFVRLCYTARAFDALDTTDWLTRLDCRPEAAGLSGREGSAEGPSTQGHGKHLAEHMPSSRILRIRLDRGWVSSPDGYNIRPERNAENAIVDGARHTLPASQASDLLHGIKSSSRFEPLLLGSQRGNTRNLPARRCIVEFW